MGLAKRMQNTATRLLSKFDESNGRIVLVKVGGEPVWDPVSAEMVLPSSTEIPLTGVTVAFSAAQVNGTTIQYGDVMCIVKAGDVEITQQDKVKIDGVQWSIVDTPLVDYTGITICHKIHCRK